jgi:aminoglycoside phosphotransferase
MYLKVLGLHDARYNSLRDEAMRLEWLGRRLPVPKVVASGSRGGYEFLLTESVSGIPAHERSGGWSRQAVASLVGRASKGISFCACCGLPFSSPCCGSHKRRG